MAKKRLRQIILPLALVLLGAYTWWSTTSLEVTRLTISDPELPAPFDGFTIAQVSDLHNGELGKDNETLLAQLAGVRPDIILLTGDLIDSRRTDVDISASFIHRCAALAPTYYVTGNHEYRVPEAYAALRAAMEESGVTILDDRALPLEREGAAITLMGVNDPAFGGFDRALEELTARTEGYTILLSHRPERISQYAQQGVDLVFAGHAHGGQVELPILGPLVAPHQGLFPQYTSGLYTREDTRMIVSRGLGTSVLPFRFSARPELVAVRLTRERDHRNSTIW